MWVYLWNQVCECNRFFIWQPHLVDKDKVTKCLTCNNHKVISLCLKPVWKVWLVKWGHWTLCMLVVWEMHTQMPACVSFLPSLPLPPVSFGWMWWYRPVIPDIFSDWGRRITRLAAWPTSETLSQNRKSGGFCLVHRASLGSVLCTANYRYIHTYIHK